MAKKVILEHIPFYRSYFEACELLDDAERLSIYDGILNYAFNGIEYEPPTRSTQLAFCLIKPILIKKMKQIQGGIKGGRPRTKTPESEAEQNDRINTTVELVKSILE